MTKKRWCLVIFLGFMVAVSIWWLNREKPVEDEPEEIVANYWVELVTDSSALYTVSAANGDYEQIARDLAAQLSQRTGVHFSYLPQEEVTGKMILVGSKPETVMKIMIR